MFGLVVLSTCLDCTSVTSISIGLSACLRFQSPPAARAAPDPLARRPPLRPSRRCCGALGGAAADGCLSISTKRALEDFIRFHKAESDIIDGHYFNEGRNNTGKVPHGGAAPERRWLRGGAEPHADADGVHLGLPLAAPGHMI